MAETFRRVRSIGDQEMADGGVIRILASTDDPVSWGGWREVLKHEDGCVDMSAARSLLINHDPDQLAGGIRAMSVDGSALTSEAEIDEDARMRSGVSVRKAVKKRTLNGISIGYSYERADTVFDEETRTLTVNKWRLLEISLTPIPADGRAQVRSFPFNQPSPDANEASRTKDHPVPEPITPAPQGAQPVPTPHDEAARAREMADLRQRAESAEREIKIRALATEHAVDVSDMDFASMKDEAEGLRALLKRKAEKDKTKPPSQSVINLTVDQADKARDAFTGAMAFRAGFRSGDMGELQKGNPLVGQGYQHAIRQYARLMGLDTSGWSDRDTAFFAMGKPEMMDQRYGRAANVTSGMFPNFVFLNAMTKIVAKGYESGAAGSQYKKISRPNAVRDFRAFYIGALSAANLTKTAEDAAFPELTKAESSYNDTVKMWGGTLSLTIQALTNDDTGSFDRMLGQAGVLADKTIDKRVFQRLLMGTSSADATSTWTSNTTSGGTLVYTTQDLMAAARAKFGLVRAAFMNKIGLDGNPLGNPPRFLIVPVTREVEALGIVGASGPGLQAGAQQSALSLEVVSSPWLELSSLTGYSTTSYYIMADPDAVTGLLVSKIQGYESIQVQPYDAGAAAAMNFKLWLPFEASFFNGANSAGTTVIPSAHQGTT